MIRKRLAATLLQTGCQVIHILAAQTVDDSRLARMLLENFQYLTKYILARKDSIGQVRSIKVAYQNFGILGYNIRGTTAVMLNGTPVSFTVRSNTLIIATVPAGASSGFVTLSTPGGILTSNVALNVVP